MILVAVYDDSFVHRQEPNFQKNCPKVAETLFQEFDSNRILSVAKFGASKDWPKY